MEMELSADIIRSEIEAVLDGVDAMAGSGVRHCRSTEAGGPFWIPMQIGLVRSSGKPATSFFRNDSLTQGSD